MAERRFSDVELERALANDLSPQRARELAERSTDADRARLAELRTEHAAFLATVDVAAEVRNIAARAGQLAPAPRPRAWQWSRWAIGGGMVAAATAALLVVVLRPPPPEDDITVKGDVALVVHLATDTGSRPLASGDTIAPGARLRFELVTGKPGYIAIVGIDGAGATTVYYPYGTRAAVAYDPARRLLPGAIALDATPGDERFYALFSAQLFVLPPDLTSYLAKPPAGLTIAEVVLHKR